MSFSGWRWRAAPAANVSTPLLLRLRNENLGGEQRSSSLWHDASGQLPTVPPMERPRELLRTGEHKPELHIELSNMQYALQPTRNSAVNFAANLGGPAQENRFRHGGIPARCNKNSCAANQKTTLPTIDFPTCPPTERSKKGHPNLNSPCLTALM